MMFMKYNINQSDSMMSVISSSSFIQDDDDDFCNNTNTNTDDDCDNKMMNTTSLEGEEILNHNNNDNNSSNNIIITTMIDYHRHQRSLFDHQYNNNRTMIPNSNDNNNANTQQLNQISSSQKSSRNRKQQLQHKRDHNILLFYKNNTYIQLHVLVMILLIQSILYNNYNNMMMMISERTKNNIMFLNVVNGFSSSASTITSNVIGKVNTHRHNHYYSTTTRESLISWSNHHNHNHNQIILTRSSSQQQYCRRCRTICHYGTVQPEIWAQCGISLLFGLYTDNVVETIFINVERYNREQILANKSKGIIKYKTDKEADEAFESTLLYSAVNSIAIAAQIMFTILLIDIIQTLTNSNYIPPISISTNIMSDDDTTDTLLSIIPLSTIAYSIGFTVWIGLTLSTIKRTIFLQSVAGPGLGRVVLYDRLLDFIILSSCAIFITADILKIDLGMGAMSVLAGSGVSALIFSFASKDLAEGIVSGFIVQSWDAFTNGDTIRLQDNTEGKVTRIGLVDTEIMLRDNVVVKIPNSQLTKIRLSNISRVKISQVEQTLRFHYNDLSLLHDVVLDEIKNEIIEQCSNNVIIDGSKPFYITLTEYQSDCIIIAKLNCHFNNIQPKSTEYFEIQQKVIFIIHNVLKEHNVSLV